ncbi:uncharacterized protein DEA37_0009731 [Paragonimus westermani]|uniref:Ubiquitin-like domain-containing protein n=1 Tax=Paragonimus westermani TaxID=34504 RepID=A0A5J4NH73_9TREM|nr:uncharacterized protein DEA37_0009731 [Paragonimus westermani]
MAGLEMFTDSTNTSGEPIVTKTDDANCLVPFVRFVVVHNRTKHHFSLSPHTTILELKQALEPLTQVPVGMQKLIYRGLLSDSMKLGDLRIVSKDAKLMLVGASQSEADRIRQVEAASADGDDVEKRENGSSGPVGELSWSEQTEHRRVLERFGKPDNAMVGILNTEEMLAPNESLTGMYDKRGRALRLRIKSDTCELWLATNDVTHKFPLATIYDVVSQPIKNHSEYHIMAFQIGPTPKSRYFVYWIPSQYVESIKTMVLQHKILRSTDLSNP